MELGPTRMWDLVNTHHNLMHTLLQSRKYTSAYRLLPKNWKLWLSEALKVHANNKCKQQTHSVSSHGCFIHLLLIKRPIPSLWSSNLNRIHIWSKQIFLEMSTYLECLRTWIRMMIHEHKHWSIMQYILHIDYFNHFSGLWCRHVPVLSH